MTPDGFERLLAALDADRDAAGTKYEALRGKLASFFRWRGATAPDELADVTLDRVVAKLADGVDISASGPGGYAHGVAIRVLQEHWRAPDRKAAALEDVPEPRRPYVADLETARVDREHRWEHERRLACSDGCLAKLPADTRDLLLKYHSGGGGERIAARRELAAAMSVPLNALRIRVHRLRQALAACVAACERNSPIGH